jgi:NAD(P) transhydrogenase subunit alpha
MDIAQLIFIFVISAFLGLELVGKIPSQLQTPLMSGSNAISGITIVGAMLATTNSDAPIVHALGFVAMILATINVVGGYVVTDRMLSMFKKKETK